MYSIYIYIYISTTPGTGSALEISFRHLLASPGNVTLKFFPLPLAGQKSKISLLCLCPAKEFRKVSLCHPAELRLPRLLPAHSGWEMHPFLFSAVRPKRNFASVRPEPSGFPRRGSPVCAPFATLRVKFCLRQYGILAVPVQAFPLNL